MESGEGIGDSSDENLLKGRTPGPSYGVPITDITVRNPASCVLPLPKGFISKRNKGFLPITFVPHDIVI